MQVQQQIRHTQPSSAAPEKLKISSADIWLLTNHPSGETRAVAAQKICRTVRKLEMSEREQAAVTQVLELIAKDAAAMVRRAMAITLKNSPNLPREIAQKLIRDVDSIAVPVLECSPVLTDDDLLDVLKSKAAAKMLAITKRSHIRGDLVRAIVRYGDSKTVASLAANDGAEIGAKLGAEMLSIYHDNDLVKDSFIARRDLPPLIVEKLIALVSGEAALRLHKRHEIPLDTALELAGRAQERAQIDFVSQSWVSRDLTALTARLHNEGRLGNSLIVRAACCGQMRFTEHAMARRAGVSLSKSALMLHDSGPIGIRTLCDAAGLTALDMVILRAAIAIYKDLELKGGHYTRSKFQQVMLERVLSLPITFTETDSQYLLEKLDALSAA